MPSLILHNRMSSMLLYQITVTAALFLFLVQVVRNLRDYVPPPDSPLPRAGERLFILIPARNEAANIAACLKGLLAQEWTDFALLVLDDSSDDGTDRIVAEIAKGDARVVLLRGEPIAPDWAGKAWACRQLGEAALAQGADRLLFLDADTRAQPGLIGRSLAFAQTTQADMVSTFPYQVTGSFWEHVVLPNLMFLVTTFLPVRMVWQSPFPQLVAACGQFELFTSDAYRAVGGHGSIPRSFHDGLQLARRIKAAGRTVRLCDGSALISCHMYAGGYAVWQGFTRNAYEGLGSPIALIAMTLLQALLFLFPFGFLAYAILALVTGSGLPAWSMGPLLQVAAILGIRILQARRFGHFGSVLLHPLSMAALIAIQWASWWRSLHKTKVAWKGRTY